MRFAHPELLLLLLLIPAFVGLFVWAWQARRRAIERFVSWNLLPALAGDIGRRRIVRGWILFLGFYFFAVIALARPQSGARTEMVQSKGADIMVALDISQSMLAADIAPSRIDRAKHEIAGLLDRLKGDRAGLVIFAGEAFLQCPLTLDYSAARMFLEPVNTDWIDVQGTDLAAALDKCVEAVAKGPKRDRAAILISDGEDHQGGLDAAIGRAKEAGLHVFTVGIGSPAGVPIAEKLPGGSVRYKKDRDGNLVLTKLDPASLIQIAQETGGRYFQAGSDLDLEAVYTEITGMAKQDQGTRKMAVYDEQYQSILLIALVLLMVEFLVSGPMRKRKEI